MDILFSVWFKRFPSLVIGSWDTVTLEKGEALKGTGNLIGLERWYRDGSISGALNLHCIESGVEVGLNDETWPRVSLLFCFNFQLSYSVYFCTSV